jgi:hypothetical protein
MGGVNEVDIWVLSHKDSEPLFKYDKIHKHIHIGAAINKDTSYEYRDDVNDNISHKNPVYSELTGQYWIWKNAKPSKIIGFEHYRRHFHLTQEDIKNILKENDIIVANNIYIGGSIKNNYKCCHSAYDIESVEDIIKTMYPEYIESWDKYINNPGFLYPCNMFITNYDIFNRMMEFTFGVLTEFEKRNNLNTLEDYRNHVKKYSVHISPAAHGVENWIPYQMRLCGFLAERLNTLWIRHNIKPEKIKEVYIEESDKLIKSNVIL